MDKLIVILAVLLLLGLFWAALVVPHVPGWMALLALISVCAIILNEIEAGKRPYK